mgnify:FL=1
MTDKLTTEQVTAAQRLIQGAANIVILTHMSPDGDAMGSSLGMMHYLRGLGKSADVVVPNTFPSFLMWMPGAQQVVVYEKQTAEADALLDAADLIICTDFNEPKRIGTLGDKMLTLACPKLLIDHHLHPSDFADVIISYSDSPSACELVYRLIYQLSALHCTQPSTLNPPLSTALNTQHSTLNSQLLSLDAATCLYTGMMTDTGNFSFNSNYPEMYEIVGQLVAQGVDKDAVYNAVFNSYSADRMRLMGYCLYQKMRLFPEYHTALIYLSRKELYKFNFQSGDAEGIVNLPLQIKDVYYSCFMREDKVNPSEVALADGCKNKVKISLRSQGDRPVNVFAHEIFGGGGHANASGGEFYGGIADAVQRFLETYRQYFKKQG